MREKYLFIVMGLILLMAMMAYAADRPSPYLPVNHVDRYPDLNREYVIPEDAPRFIPRYGELDLMGDTLIVGTTWWESQHNGTVGRMIGLQADRDGVPTVHIVWTDLVAEGGVRHVKYSRAFEVGGDMQYELGTPAVVDAAARAGYTTLAFNGEQGLAFPAYHATANVANPYQSRLAAEWSIFPFIFTEFTIPNYQQNENIWPHAALGYYQGEAYVHVLTSSNRPDDPAALQDILYSRHHWLAGNETFQMAAQQVVTHDGMNISGDVGCSYDGRRVAVAQTVPHDIDDIPREDHNQLNNNVYLWISEDGGATWDWEDYINLTSFLDPDPDLLPDSLAADMDTVRAYTDINVYFDHDDILHVAFTTPCYFYYENTMTWTSVIYHWDEESDVFTMVADGRFWNWVAPGAWQRQANRPSMYQDEETGVLYLIYQQYGVPGDTTADGIPNDRSAGGYSNGEVFITASPPNNEFGDWYGRLWAKGVNLTDTRGVGGAIPAGECRNEREPNISLYNEGDYLHIFYVLDLDAGFTAQEEGEFTECPVIWHRVAKEDVLDAFEEQGEWLPNYPMHVDLSQHWEDPNDYEWGDGGFFNHGGDNPPPPPVTLTVPLQRNYFELVSTYVQPASLYAPTVFGGINALEIVYQDDGHIFIPNPFINTIGNITMTEGYQIFCSAVSQWSVTGYAIAEDTPYSLMANRWNWLGYPFDHPVPIVTALSTIVNHIEIIQTDAGGIYIPPPVGINTIGNMTSGTGYFAFVRQALTFTYTDVGRIAAGTTSDVWEIPEVEGAPTPTGLPYTVLVSLTDDLLTRNPATIELLDGKTLVGKAIALTERELTPVIAWGGSEEHGLSGFTAGNPMTVVVRAANGEVLASMENAGRFGEAPYASVTVSSDFSLPTEFSVKAGYPNPFNPTITIPFALPNSGNVNIIVFNLLGQQVFQTQSQFEAGYHKFVFDATSIGHELVSGVYFIQVSFNNQTKAQKVMLLK